MKLPFFAVIFIFLSATIIPAQTEILHGNPELFVTGFTFPEGPVFDRSGNLYLVDYRDTEIFKVTPDGIVQVVLDTGAFNNSALFDREGNLYITSHIRRAVLKLDTSGKLTVVTETSEGDSLLGPNDLTWGEEKRLYFTDPHGSNVKNPIGHVHYIDTDGRTKHFAHNLAFPNGIAYNRFDHRLYVAETQRNRILRYAIKPDGSAGKCEIFFRFDDGGNPDGMKFDIAGNLWVAEWIRGDVWCISPEGNKITRIPIPEDHVMNLTFGGPDDRTLFVTAYSGNFVGCVYRIRMPYPGVPVVPE